MPQTQQEREAEFTRRLEKEFNLTREELSKIHEHLARKYKVEKTSMSYEEYKNAASEVVSRIR